MEWIHSHKNKILIGIIILFHLVGSVGLAIPSTKAYFLSLSSYNLLLSFLVVLIAPGLKRLRFYLFVLFVFLIGYGVEWIGVHTHFLFGNYSYGKNLGFKLSGIPLIIGINWVVLILVTHSISLKFLNHRIFTPVLAAIFMVGLDILIEPVAIKSDYWSWFENQIPVFNYVCWFFISLIIHFIYRKIRLTEQNTVYNCIYIVLVVFFSIQLI
jgi:putative membrane protein